MQLHVNHRISFNVSNFCPLCFRSLIMSFTRCFLLASVTFVLTTLGSNSVQAALVNIANGKPVIGSTNDINGNAYNSTAGDFDLSNVTDGQTASPDNNTGTITETFANDGYWLGPNLASTAYFVLDLGAAYRIDQIVLFNTSNGSPQERGTGNFTVKASNSITNVGALGDDLSGTIVTLASGTLAPENNTPTTVVPQSFLSADTATAYRYIRFDALSISALDGANGVGLNEIRLFEAVPEPASLILLLIGCCAVVGARRMTHRRLALSIALALLVVCTAASVSQAVVVPIANGDFETLIEADGGISGLNNVPLWTATTSGGIYQATYDPPFGRLEGAGVENNWGYMGFPGTATLLQKLSPTLGVANSSTYVLTVTVGREVSNAYPLFPNVGDGVSTGDVFARLLVDNSVLQDGSSLVAMPGFISNVTPTPASAGDIVNWTLTWTTGNSEALAGDALYVQLQATTVTGAEVYWDNVGLTVNAVPEPASAGLALLGFCGVAAARRASQRRRSA
jgi:hypothetical protein